MNRVLRGFLAVWAATATSCAWYVTEADRRQAADRDGDGYASSRWPTGTDCDDSNPQVHPAAQELCDDAIDNDCNGAVDDVGIGQVSWYRDDDRDGYGRTDVTREACSTASQVGWSLESGDCDDQRRDRNPSIPDDDCDAVDDNCSGTPDDEAEVFYADDDRDGFGDEMRPLGLCERPVGSAPNGDDCDDTLATVNPGAVEVCDAIDNDCDSIVDEDAAATVNGANFDTAELALANALVLGHPANLCPGEHILGGTIQVEDDDVLVVRGVQGRDVTRLTSQPGESVVEVSGTGSFTMEGIETTSSGGTSAVWAFDKSTLTVRDSRFLDASSGIALSGPKSGPGIRASIENSEFIGGRSGFGSAIGALFNFDMTLLDCLVADNEGIALMSWSIDSSSILIEDSTITNNGSGVSGPPVLGNQVESIRTYWGAPGIDDNGVDAYEQSWSGTASFVCKDREGTFSCR